MKRSAKAREEHKDKQTTRKDKLEKARKARRGSVRKARASPQGSAQKRSRSSGDDTCETRGQRSRRS